MRTKSYCTNAASFKLRLYLYNAASGLLRQAWLMRQSRRSKSHLAQAIGVAVIQQGHRVLCRETHALVDELAEAQLAGTRKATLAQLTTIPLLIVDDLGMRKLPPTAGEDLLEIVMRRCERASTLITSNRPVEDWGKLLGDTAAVTALLRPLALSGAHALQHTRLSARPYGRFALSTED